MKTKTGMAIIQNNNSTCKSKTSKHDKVYNQLKMITATELEIKYARHLADNDPKVRKNALKVLKRWFMKRGTIIDNDFSVLWSGLYVTFWMSDKPLIQEECAESIAALTNILDSRLALKFFESALSRLSMEWYGIDQLRMDKFLMLVRRLLRKSLQVLIAAEHDTDVMSQYQTIITSVLCSGPTVNNLGLKLHLADIYLEEVAKTHGQDVEPAVVTQLLQPFIHTICVGKDRRLLGEVAKAVFRQLMRQSDEGLEFDDRYKAWRQMGFPGGDISCMQLNKEINDVKGKDDDEDDDEDAPERVLDPRAGRVNVNLPQIKFDAGEIADLLDEAKFDANATSMNRKMAKKLISEFRTLTTGEFPLNKNQCTVDLPHKEKGIVRKSANALLDFEDKLQNDIDKNRKRKKSTPSDVHESNNKRKKRNDLSDTDNITCNDPKAMLSLALTSLSGISLKQRANNNNGQMQKFIQNVKRRKINRQDKTKSQMRLDIENGNYEWKFTRPSGTWYVLKGLNSPTKVTSTKLNTDLYIEHDNAPQEFAIRDSDATPSRTSHPKSKFKWEMIDDTIACTKGGSNSFTTPFITVKKGVKAEEKANREKMSKLVKIHKITSPQVILQQLPPKAFITPKNRAVVNKNNFIKSSEKKVKIALNLNQSQDIHEHEMQVKTSPAIPFDANKKPLKPLLKSQCGRFSFSPINPFAKSAKQRRSLMF